MNTETSKIAATALRTGMVLADGATVREVDTRLSARRGGHYYGILVTLPGGTLHHKRWINAAGTQTVIVS